VHFKSKEAAAQIRFRIFTLQNRLVKELRLQNVGNEYIAEWDGQDDRQEIHQGIYIYQIEVNGKAYNGTCVIAK
jgi:hypothetical protein